VIEKSLEGKVLRLGAYGLADDHATGRYVLLLEGVGLLEFEASGEWRMYLALVGHGDQLWVMVEARKQRGDWRLKKAHCAQLGPIEELLKGRIEA
jgi:hypothetical protein